MLTLFTKTYIDDLYGTFNFQNNVWINPNTSILGSSNIQLVVTGSRFGMSRSIISQLLEFESDFESQKPAMADALFNDYYLPMKHAIESGILKTDLSQFPFIDSYRDIWPFIEIKRIRFIKVQEKKGIEVAMTAQWDPEQKVGFVFHENGDLAFKQSIFD